MPSEATRIDCMKKLRLFKEFVPCRLTTNMSFEWTLLRIYRIIAWFRSLTYYNFENESGGSRCTLTFQTEKEHYLK